MKIIYFAQTCPPEPGATKRPLEQAKVLVNLGHEVTLITAMPSYPLGRVYMTYRHKLWFTETIGGVKVLRVWSIVAANHGVVRRMLSFVTFSLAAAIAGLRQGPVDAVMGSVPKPFTEIAAWLVARIRRAIFIVEMRDVMPDTLLTAGFSNTSFGYRLLERYYRWIYSRVDVFAVAYIWMIDVLRERGAERAVMLQLSHAVDPPVISKSREDLRAVLGYTDSFVVTYSGSFSSYYKVPLMIAVAEQLLKPHPEIVFLIIGTGEDAVEVEQTVKNKGLHNVNLLGGIEPEKVAQYLNASDLFLQTQHLPNITDGTKILEYFWAGKPVINICGHPAAKGQAEHLAVGISVSASNPAEAANAIQFYASDGSARRAAGENAMKFVKDKFTRQLVVTKFATELSAIIDEKCNEH